MALQDNELLLLKKKKNHQSHPINSTQFPEVNETSFEKHGGNNDRGCECGRGWNNQYRECSNHNSSKRNNTAYHQKNKNGKGLQNKLSKGHENKCYKCGMEGHWSCTCYTLKHLVNLYQASIKEKGK